ncbi:hypothetical protein BCD67_20910 [Oscillatoriales cyanobacterium USR001]|nr:hypothetical protein BCD67_20910 [Oscillatoriales cyanobacterium USR001]
MMITETNTEVMTDEEWAIAHAIAHTLTKDQIRIESTSDGILTELKTSTSYLQSIINQDNAGDRFFTYLKTLLTKGEKFIHSEQTPHYRHSIEKACRKYLQEYQVDAQTMLKILGWASRLIRYYKVESVAEVLFTLPKKRHFQIGDILEAEVTKKNNKGSKVTYQVKGESYNEKEPKNFDLIPEQGMVKVQVVSLNPDDGSINHVKFVKQ